MRRRRRKREQEEDELVVGGESHGTGLGQGLVWGGDFGRCCSKGSLARGRKVRERQSWWRDYYYNRAKRSRRLRTIADDYAYS